jgi:hypothetical protein
MLTMYAGTACIVQHCGQATNTAVLASGLRVSFVSQASSSAAARIVKDRRGRVCAIALGGHGFLQLPDAAWGMSRYGSSSPAYGALEPGSK